MEEDRDALGFVLAIYAKPWKVSAHSVLSKFLSKWKVPRITEEKIGEFVSATNSSHDVFAGVQKLAPDFEFSLQQVEEFTVAAKKCPHNLAKAIPFVYGNAIGFFARLKESVDFHELDVVLESLFNLATCDPSYSLFIYLLIVERALVVAGAGFPEKTFSFILAQICFYEKPCAKCLYVLLDMLKSTQGNDVLGMKVVNSMQKVVADLAKFNVPVDRKRVVGFTAEQLGQWVKTGFKSLYVVSRMSYIEEYGQLYRRVGEAMREQAARIQDELPANRDLCFDDRVEPCEEDVECDEPLDGDVGQVIDQINKVMNIPLADLVGLDISNRIGCIRGMFGKDLDRRYAEEFLVGLGMFEDSRNEIRFKIMYILIASILPMNWKPVDVLVDCMFHEDLFDPSMTVFFDIESMTKISYFRQKIVDNVFANGAGNLDYFFEKFAKHPMIFSELLLRSLNRSVYRCLSNRFLEIFVDNESRLRRLYNDGQKDVVLLARSCNLVFFTRLFSITSIRGMLAHFDGIAGRILSMASERSFHSGLRMEAHRLIFEPGSDDFSLGVRLAGNILNITTYKGPGKWMQIIEELLLMFSQSLKRNHELKVYVGEFLRDACKTVRKCSTHEMLMTVLDLANGADTLDDAVIAMFSDIIKTVEKSLSRELLSVLFRLLYGSIDDEGISTEEQNEAVLYGRHFISRANVLPLILSVFVHFGQTDLFCSILNELCDYSTVNRLIMHEGEFDICILDYLTNFPGETIFHGISIESCSETDLIGLVFVFLNVASAKSSAIVAQKLLNFVLRGQVAPKLGPYLIPLDARLEACARTAIPIAVKDVCAESVDINIQSVYSGSTIAFKCFVDEPVMRQCKYEVVVCRVVPVLTLVIREMNLYCVTSYANREQFSLLTELEGNKWNAIVITVQQTQEQKLQIKVSRNADAVMSTEVLIEPGKPDDTAFIIFGNSIALSGDMNYVLSSVNIGVIGFYESVFTQDHIKRFWNSSLTTSGLSERPALVFPETEAVTSKRCLSRWFEKDEYCTILPNLSQIFLHVFPVCSLVPGFENLSLVKDPQTLVTCIKFFVGPRVSEVIDQIAYLLPRNPRHVLTMNLYLSFYDLLHTVTSKQLLFDLIILNFDIWLRGTDENIQTILGHWLDIVLKNHKILFQRKGILASLLTDIRRYLYYDKDSEPIACDFERDPELRINSCLDCIYAIILGLADPLFTSEDIVTYLECIVTCKDVRQIEKMLSYATPLLSTIKTEEKFSSLLHCLDITQFPSLLPLMFHTLYLGAGQLFYVESILFSYQLPVDYQVKALLTELRQFPELFAICLMSAINSPQEQQMEVASVLDQFRNSQLTLRVIGKCKMWIIWPTLFALQCDLGVQSTVLSFISAVICEEGSLVSLYMLMSFLDLIELSTSMSPEKVRVVVLQNVLSGIDQTKIPQFELVVIERCFQVLYLRCVTDPISSELRKEWENSEYFDGIKESAMKTSRITSHEELSNLLDGVASLRYDYILVIPHDLGLMNAETAALTQVIASLGKDVGTNSFMHYFLAYANSYPQQKPDRKPKMIRAFAKYEKDVFIPYISSVKKATMNFAKKLISWFSRQNSILRQYLETKANLSDPTLRVLKEREFENQVSEQLWRCTVKFFVHERQLFDRDYFVWKRDFHFSQSLATFHLKRSVALKSVPFATEQHSGRQHLAFFVCKRIKVDTAKRFNYYLFEDRILLTSDVKSKFLLLKEITHIMVRTRTQRASGLEFFCANGRSVLLDFAPSLASDVTKTLRNVRMPNLVLFNDKGYRTGINDSGLIAKWRDNTITNYDFLMQLNLMSGRSMLDSENYVIFPWVVLADEARRDLSLPIAAQSAKKLEHYRSVLREAKRGGEDNYVFGTAPSNPMFLSFYFFRLEPYTALHKRIHDGRFDCPERMFCVMDDFLNGIEGNRECKESTPEFYSFPEVFLNLVKGCEVGDLVVPQWADNLFDYIYKCRKALESSETSENLNKWVDLLFGVCQQGAEAEEKCNVFLPQLYSSVWREKQESPEVILTMLKNLGSIPPQIFSHHISPRLARKKTDANRRSTPFACEDVHEACILSLSIKAVVAVVSKASEVNIHVFALDCELMPIVGRKSQCQDQHVIVPHHASLFVFNKRDGSVSRITRDGDTFKFTPTEMQPEFVIPGLEGSDTIFIGNRFGLIHQYNTSGNGSSEFVMQIVTSSIRALAISQDLGVIACGTTDGYLEVYSLTSKRFVKSHPLGSAFIRHVIITPSLGFIIVKTDQDIWLFTINGFFIKKFECSLEITIFTTWKNREGFDMVSCCDIDGRVLTFEAYYPERMQVTVVFGHRILDMRYNAEMDLLVIVTTKPELHVVPIIMQ